MATAGELPILLKYEDRTSPGVLHVQSYDKRDRIKRAVIAWVGFWILAILCIPLIGIHLFLIPAFLIAGPLVAYRRFHAPFSSESATGRCPVCNNDITIKLEPKERPDLWKYCPSCDSNLHLVENHEARATDAAANA